MKLLSRHQNFMIYLQSIIIIIIIITTVTTTIIHHGLGLDTPLSQIMSL